MKKQILLVALVIGLLSACGPQIPAAFSTDTTAAEIVETDGLSLEKTAVSSQPQVCSPTSGIMAKETEAIPPQAPSTVPPAPQQQPAEPTPDLEAPYIRAAIEDLMLRMNISPTVITVQTVEAVNWSSSSLGCPQPGVMYSDVIEPGYLVTLEALGTIYEYHTDQQIQVVLCCGEGEESYPLLPVIPIATDERIQDDKPWMPVE